MRRSTPPLIFIRCGKIKGVARASSLLAYVYIQQPFFLGEKKVPFDSAQPSHRFKPTQELNRPLVADFQPTQLRNAPNPK